MPVVTGSSRRSLDAGKGAQALRWLLIDTVSRLFQAAGIDRAPSGAAVGVFLTGLPLLPLREVVSWFLDLHGPAELIEAGGAGPIAALNRAAGALALGECEAAIVLIHQSERLVALLLEPAERVRARGGAVLATVERSWHRHLGRAGAPPADGAPLDLEPLLRLLEARGDGLASVTLEAGEGALFEVRRPGEEEARPHDPIIAIQDATGHPSTFWIHGVSGDVGWVLGLARALGPLVPVLGIEAQGFDGRGAVLDTIEAMAEHYATGILARGIQGPVWLGGYSGGGMLAVETARRLAPRGIATERVFLLDANAPGNDSLAEAHVEGFIFLLAGNWYGHLWGADRLLDFSVLEGQPPERQLELTLDHLFRHARPPLSREAVRRRLTTMDRICAATRHAMRVFVPEPLPGPVEVTLFRCRQGLGDHGSRFRIPPSRIQGDYRAGWESLFERPMRVIEVEGDHWELLSPERVLGIAALIRQPAPHRPA
jgi:thioesterase domain-containing protein